MKAKELRIGNLIRYNDTKEVCRVYQLEHRYKNVYRINGLNENPDVEPIPITEEWLLKLGFEVEKNGGIVFASKDDNCKFYVYCENNKTWKIGKYNNGFKHIYYVHQLQNLYFALTGEELTSE